jgi:hypothetical protein
MGFQSPVSLQQQYSLLSRESEWEVVPAALHNGIGLLPWSPLAGGFLAGKYRRGGTPAPDTRAGSRQPLYQWTSAGYAESDRNRGTGQRDRSLETSAQALDPLSEPDPLIRWDVSDRSEIPRPGGIRIFFLSWMNCPGELQNVTSSVR